MKRTVFAALLLSTSLAWSQNPFTGTWRVLPDKIQLPQKPLELQVKSGQWTCSSCVPKIDVKADGSPHPVTGSPYYDSMTVKIIDNNSAETSSTKTGKTMGETSYAVSADGNTLTIKYKDYTSASGEMETGTNVFTRIGKAPSGNKLSGQWRSAKIEDASANQLEYTFSGEGNELTYKTKTGEGYTAKLDGADYPYQGDPGITSVSLRQINDRTIEESDKRDGKTILIERIEVSPDGKTMTVDIQDKLHGQTLKVTAAKQEASTAGK